MSDTTHFTHEALALQIVALVHTRPEGEAAVAITRMLDQVSADARELLDPDRSMSLAWKICESLRVLEAAISVQPDLDVAAVVRGELVAEATLRAHDDGYEQGRLAGISVGVEQGRREMATHAWWPGLSLGHLALIKLGLEVIGEQMRVDPKLLHEYGQLRKQVVREIEMRLPLAAPAPVPPEEPR